MTINVAIIGAGNIAGPYAEDMVRYDAIRLTGITDLDRPKAEELAGKVGCAVYDDLAALLADEQVDIVVNLSSHHAHYPLTMQCLEAGKHVYSEKPLATTAAQAHELVERARAKGLRLACSPFTILGEAQQTAWQMIRKGRLGEVRVVYAEVNWGRIEAWHPAPGPFYEVGALYDVGVYPLTILTAMFGPVRRVSSYGRMLYPDRVTKDGTPFTITTPDFAVSMLEMDNGTLVRLTTNFYVGHHNRQTGLEFHGDLGSLYMESWLNLDTTVHHAEFDATYAPVEPVRVAADSLPWGRGVLELAQAIAEDRPHRLSGEHAAHIVDVLEAASQSMTAEKPVAVTSTFPPLAPLAWA